MAAPSPSDNSLAGSPQPGELLGGKYRIERVIGVGGMGVVLSALHEELGERVAIKCLLPQLANDTVFVARFQREARAAVKIRSEHIARVLDVAKTEAGIPFIVMEYLEGQDLGALLERQPRIAPSLAIGYVLQACEALAEAHALGIVHRDLKPENLFLTTHADGTECVKVMDFGISKMADAGPDNLSLTRTGGGVMGSPLYMAPEQMRSTKDADPRTDIWALGAMLFEFITGDPPFMAASIQEIVAMIVQDSTPSLLERAAKKGVPVSAELDAAVQRSLQKRPAERYADVAEFAHALAPFGDDEARASALRIARVLERRGRPPAASGSYPFVSTAPSAPAVLPMTPPAPARREGAGTQSAATWTDIRPPVRDRSRIRIFTALGVLAAAVVGILVMLSLRSTPTPPVAALPPTTPASSADIPPPELPKAPENDALPNEVASAEATASSHASNTGNAATIPSGTPRKPGSRPDKTAGKKPDTASDPPPPPAQPPVPAASTTKPNTGLANGRHD